MFFRSDTEQKVVKKERIYWLGILVMSGYSRDANMCKWKIRSIQTHWDQILNTR